MSRLGTLRRQLPVLYALAAICGAVALAGPCRAAEPPNCTPLLLYGDGEHDDTAALNAWLRGDAVVWADSGAAVGPEIAGRTFRLSDAIYVQSGTNRRLDHFRLVWPERHETVSADSMQAGGDPDKPPTAVNLHIEGGDPGEGVAFDAPDPPPGQRDTRTRCFTS